MYVIAPAAHENGPCKLGISIDPTKRLKQLQTGYPEELSIKYTEEVEAEKVRLFERLLHRDLRHLRKHGEWFCLPVGHAIGHVQFTIIEYDGVTELEERVRTRRI